MVLKFLINDGINHMKKDSCCFGIQSWHGKIQWPDYFCYEHKAKKVNSFDFGWDLMMSLVRPHMSDFLAIGGLITPLKSKDFYTKVRNNLIPLPSSMPREGCVRFSKRIHIELAVKQQIIKCKVISKCSKCHNHVCGKHTYLVCESSKKWNNDLVIRSHWYASLQSRLDWFCSFLHLWRHNCELLSKNECLQISNIWKAKKRWYKITKVIIKVENCWLLLILLLQSFRSDKSSCNECYILCSLL